MKIPVATLAHPSKPKRASLPMIRIAQPMTSEPPAEPSAQSSNTDEPSVTNSSRFELSAAFAREIAYREFAAAPKAKAPNSNSCCVSAYRSPKADRPLAAHSADSTKRRSILSDAIPMGYCASAPPMILAAIKAGTKDGSPVCAST